MTTTTNRIEQLDGRRFISRHRSGVEIYYDSRHKITKVKCEGGVIMELYQQAIANNRRLEQLLSQMRDLSQQALLGSVPGVRRRRKIDPKTTLS